MHYNLDIHPIPADVPYVNELSLAGKVPYETKDTKLLSPTRLRSVRYRLKTL